MGSSDKDQTQNSEISPEVRRKLTTEVLANMQKELSASEQHLLNKPLTAPEELSAEDQSLLDLIIALIEKKELDPYNLSTLLNNAEIAKLNPEQQAQAEIDGLNILTTIREIYKQYQSKLTSTYQFQYQLHQLRLLKERLEAQSGDIYKI